MIRSFASTGNRCAWFHFSEDISTPRQRRQHTMDGVIASPSTSFVTARRYASAVLDMGLCLSVCVSLSLCLSVTYRSSVETDKWIDTVFDTDACRLIWLCGILARTALDSTFKSHLIQKKKMKNKKEEEEEEQDASFQLSYTVS